MKAPCPGRGADSFLDHAPTQGAELACSLFSVVLGSGLWDVLSCPLSFLVIPKVSIKEYGLLGACTVFTACFLLVDIEVLGRMFYSHRLWKAQTTILQKHYSLYF